MRVVLETESNQLCDGYCCLLGRLRSHQKDSLLGTAEKQFLDWVERPNGKVDSTGPPLQS